MVNNVPRYFAFNSTCIGASHLKLEKVCQDFSNSYSTDKYAIIAVADGHGSEKHFRSDRGACFAVEAALNCIKEVIHYMFDLDTDSNIYTLEKSIIAEWYKRIDDDLKNDPTKEDKYQPYGTTLLAVGVSLLCGYWFAIQIGDGKCVCIENDDSVTQPVPWDDRCFLNRTTSLCDEDAIHHFRHHFSLSLPKAVFIGSDGIDDSFPINENEKHLEKFYKSVYYNFIKEGFKKGEVQLKEMLPLFTQKGSGDDVSIAGVIKI